MTYLKHNEKFIVPNRSVNTDVSAFKVRSNLSVHLDEYAGI